MWAYARGVFDPQPGVVYDFCTGRGSQYPYDFLGEWTGTLVRDGYIGYEKALLLDDRFDAGCMAHSRRKFDELFKANASPVATQAIQRIAWLYRIEADARDLTAQQRLQMRHKRSRPLCEELHIWLQLERKRVPDGSGIAKAIDYSLNRWAALTRFLLDGDVPIDNNHLENQMRPWGVGRSNANCAFMRSSPLRPCRRAELLSSPARRHGFGLRIKRRVSAAGNIASGSIGPVPTTQPLALCFPAYSESVLSRLRSDGNAVFVIGHLCATHARAVFM
jgi:hypothetical protein